MSVDKRKKQLLELVVKNHIENSEPVGSTFLVEAGNLDVSGATVRNDMQELEEEGLVAQPHTSAGRVPTEAGYRYYVENMMEPQSDHQDKIEDLINEDYKEQVKIKNIAKFAADETDAATIVSFNFRDVYYTGLSKLFSQPEFQDYDYTLHVSQIFDRCEEQIQNVQELIESDVEVLIGNNNPLGSRCSLVASRFNDEVMFMILGPIRMDYQKAVGFNQNLQELT